jgi:hypothetical protein
MSEYGDFSPIMLVRYHFFADMADSNLTFTVENVWRGGHYELFLHPAMDTSEELCSLLKALWAFPSLDGCYQRRDVEPSAQARLQPCENGVAGHLYGLATFPNSSLIVCGSYTADYSEEGESDAAHWVSFYIPLGALSRVLPVGAYPFGPMDRVSEWKPVVDSYLAEIARWTHSTVPISFALIGFEVNVAAISPQTIRANGIPNERNEGILWNDGVDLKWYPATRP